MKAMRQQRFKYDREVYDIHSLPLDHIDRLTLERMHPNERVLELGCATGYMTQYLTHVLHSNVVAVDISTTATRIARRFTPTVVAGDLNTQAVWKKISTFGQFDTVLASNVIEHLSDTNYQLSQIYRVLRRQGRLIIVVPNICWWRSRLWLLRGRWKYEEYGLFDKTHLRFFSLTSLREELHNAGFQVMDEAYDPAGGAKWLTPVLKKFPNAYAYQVVMVAQKGSKN